MALPIFRTLSGRWLAVMFLFFAAGIAALWYSALAAHEGAVLRERGRELQAIAELKIDFVRLWLEERRGDAAVQAGRLMMARALVPGARSYAVEEVREQLETVRKVYRFKAVTLLDRTAGKRFVAGALSDFGLGATRAAAIAAMERGQDYVGLAYHPEDGGRHHVDIDVAAPVADRSRPDAPIVGALAFHLDSRLHLDPLLRGWPAPSRSGEAFLVEHKDGELVYLSSLRHADAARLRRDGRDTSLPAALAARGRQGVTEGLDYRGTPVLAAVGQVPGMPWHVVAKLDRDEILAPVRREALWSGALSALLVLALGLALLSWHRRMQSELALAQQAASREALRASEARFRGLHEHGWDINLLFDREMVVRYASPSAERYLGRAAVGEPITSGTATVHPEDVPLVEAARKAAIAAPGVPQTLTHRFRREQGGWWMAEASFTSYFDDPDIGALSYVARDISGRIRAEAARDESEARYRLLFQLSPEAVFVHRDRRVLFANDAAVRLFRAASVAALAATDLRERVSPADWPLVEARIASLADGGEANLRPHELRYRTLDGGEIHVEATAARIVIDGEPAILSVVRDITERREAEAQRLAHAREQRDALVREVHHRIKNHLQGLTGLLRQEGLRQPALVPALDNVIARIGAIAVVHGLQGREAGEAVQLAGLVTEVAAFLGGVAAARIVVEDCPAQCRRTCRWQVQPEEGVPVALVLNELLTNALRHGAADAAVRVGAACDGAGACVRIGHAGRLPAGFDLAAGTGLGTGLTLVRALLPHEGARLQIAADAAGGVETRLCLAPPVLAAAAPAQVASRR